MKFCSSITVHNTGPDGWEKGDGRLGFVVVSQVSKRDRGHPPTHLRRSWFQKFWVRHSPVGAILSNEDLRLTFLSDTSIRQLLNNPDAHLEGRITVEPPPAEMQLGPCSIDLTLSTSFARFRRFPLLLRWKIFDPLSTKSEKQAIQDQWYRYYTVTNTKGFLIRPGEVVLTTSEEYINLPKSVLGLITGRSSYSRMGIEVHLTQDLNQPGHSGRVLLQIKNNAPFSIRLYPGMRIAQLLIAKLDQPCHTGYDESPQSKYKKEKGGIATWWIRDPELENRPIISRLTDLTKFLEVLLFVSVLFSIFVAIDHGGQGILSIPIFRTSIGISALVAAIRLVIYIRH